MNRLTHNVHIIGQLVQIRFTSWYRVIAVRCHNWIRWRRIVAGLVSCRLDNFVHNIWSSCMGEKNTSTKGTLLLGTVTNVITLRSLFGRQLYIYIYTYCLTIVRLVFGTVECAAGPRHIEMTLFVVQSSDVVYSHVLVLLLIGHNRVFT